MSESRSSSVGRDALGILLIAVAFLSGVGVVMSMLRPIPENPSSFTAIYIALVGAIGPIAGLFLSLGLLVIGIRLWIAGFNDRVGRDLFGVLITTLALSILVGTVTPDLAGRFGNVGGGAVTRRLTMFVGLPFGLVCVLLPVWLFWLRARVAPRNTAGLSPRLTARQNPGQVAPAAQRPAESAAHANPVIPSAATPLGTIVEPHRAPRDVFKTETSASGSPSVQRATAASVSTSLPQAHPSQVHKPPHTDVRLHGGIPAGAQPLAPIHVQPLQSSPRPSPLPSEPILDHRDTRESAGADLVAARVAAIEPVDHRLDASDEELRAAEPAVDFESKTLSSATLELAIADPRGVQSEDELAELAELEREAELEDDELEVSELEGEDELTLAPVETPAETPVVRLAPEVEPISNRPPQPSWEQPSLFDEEPVDAYGTPLSLVDALRKANDDTAERLSELESEPAPPPVAEPAASSSLFDATEGAESAEDEDELEDAAVAVIEEDDDEEDAEDAEDAADDEEAELETLPAARAELEDDEDELREVVVQPIAPAPVAVVEEPRPTRIRKDDDDEHAPADPEPVRELVSESAIDDVVYRAGCLFVDRGRVAVSMLQREFGLDFKAATEVLDQLQKAGLIGPYLGGQRRDILLSREEWAQRVGVA